MIESIFYGLWPSARSAYYQGLALSQVIQSATLLIMSWMLIKRQLPDLKFVPYRWSVNLFREMLGYGMNFQIVGIAQLLFEPVTKSLLTKFGGLAMVGYYEMANRMVMQLRTLLVAGNQVLVPVIADVYERKPQDTVVIYRKSYRLIFFFSAPYFCLIIALTPLISEIWIGRYEHIFVLSSFVLTVAWWVNTLGGPSYIAYLGMGRLRWNTLGHVIIGTLNLILGYWFGILSEGTGPIWAWAIALIAGSIVIVISYHLENRIKLETLIPRDMLGILLVCIALCLSCLLMYYELLYRIHASIGMGAITTLFLLCVLPLLWRHPLRIRLMSFVKGS